MRALPRGWRRQAGGQRWNFSGNTDNGDGLLQRPLGTSALARGMQNQSRNDRYCIIGAGASGLAVAKNFVERGIPFDCLEREQDIGGLWNIATPSGVVYETTHLVSCISSTGYDDLPMLDEAYPEYPSHERVLGYFRDYVRDRK